jgi:5-formyltetrahydrofolate cyclo-ligase
MIMPAMAFTLDGQRLGKGGGYYDTFLNKMSSSDLHFPMLIGVAFREQILEELPVDDHDFHIDQVITADN